MSDIFANLDKIKILLVEDEPEVRNITIRLLEHLNYLVKAVAGGHDAIKTIQDQTNIFDLVMTDYSMPDMDGIELTMNLKKISPDIPVLLCSGRDNSGDSQSLFDVGVADILTKPYTKNELDLSIKKAIKQ